MLWTPDFCPPGDACTIEIAEDWSAVIAFHHACPHHQSLRTGGLSDQQVYTAIVQSSRVKETARDVTKLELGSVDAPTYTVAANGDITIQSGATGANKTKVQTAVTTSLLSVSQPVGTCKVTVV